jgi:DNA-binding transcriptional LysR family regulator
MELRQLRYLVALADERHFTRAAARLHIAQPALSQQVKRLEDEIGVALVDRTTRHVALTPAGELLVARARRALSEVDAAAAELADLAGVRTGHVVIGAMRSTGRFDLSALLAAFHARHPGIELLVREEPSEVMLQRLHADTLDVAFLAVNTLDAGPDIQLHPLWDEPLVALLAPGHPLAGSGSTWSSCATTGSSCGAKAARCAGSSCRARARPASSRRWHSSRPRARGSARWSRAASASRSRRHRRPRTRARRWQWSRSAARASPAT